MPDAVLAQGIINGALVYGALYTVGLFVVGMVCQFKPVVFGAIATAGITYLSFLVQIMEGPVWMIGLGMYGSVIMGAATGILLLFFLWP